MNFTKPPLTIQQQINKLKNRGLSFGNEPKAAHYLSNISYYRLRAYTYPFQDNTSPEHPFNREVSFEEIINLYVFDRRLRILIFNALEKIEIALRTKIIYEYSNAFGSHWFEDENMYWNLAQFDTDMETLDIEIDRSKETFIEHYKNNYSNPPSPPAWMSLEVASFGLLSKLFRNLKNGPMKTKVAREFGLPTSEILSSWMYAITGIRNIVAHHGRLWNRRFIIKPTIPSRTINPFLNNTRIFRNKIYAIFCCMNYILKIISPGNSFVTDLKELLTSSHLIDLHEMGFPDDWEEEEIWKE
jgi:abortive infection bacteriophage resistance protein